MEILFTIIAVTMWIIIIGFMVYACIWNFGPVSDKDIDAYSFAELNIKYDIRLYKLQTDQDKDKIYNEK